MQPIPAKPTTKTAEQVIVPISMPFEKAYQVEWEIRHGPNKGVRGKMGKLLEDRMLDLGNLGYIATHAWNPNARAAAFTLLARQLGQPQTLKETLRYGPEVISQGTYLEDQQQESLALAAMYTGLGLGVGFTVILSLLWRAGEVILGGSPWPAVLLALLIVLLAIVVPVGLYTISKIRGEISNFRYYRLGRDGEEWVVDKVRALLDNQWVVFRNVNLPRGKGDIDLVLVGPPGVWVLEVKAFNFDVRVEDNAWKILKGKKWQPMGFNPVAQVRMNAQDLRFFFERHGVVLRLNAAIVLTQPQQVSNIGPTVEPVWKQFEIDEKLNQLNTLPASLADVDKERILTALKEAANDNQARHSSR